MVCLGLSLDEDRVLLKFLGGRHGGNRKNVRKSLSKTDVLI
jgi:hypothetical protein